MIVPARAVWTLHVVLVMHAQVPYHGIPVMLKRGHAGRDSTLTCMSCDHTAKINGHATAKKVHSRSR